MADRVYFQPLNVPTVTKILRREKPDAVMLSFGGQTALNLGLELHDSGVFKDLRITVLGTPVSAIKVTEDRELLQKIPGRDRHLKPHEAGRLHPAGGLGWSTYDRLPVMLRSGFSLGGLGSGRINDAAELRYQVSRS